MVSMIVFVFWVPADSNKGNSICNGFLPVCFFPSLFFSPHLLCGTHYTINHNLRCFYLCFFSPLPFGFVLLDKQVLGECLSIGVEGGRRVYRRGTEGKVSAVEPLAEGLSVPRFRHTPDLRASCTWRRAELNVFVLVVGGGGCCSVYGHFRYYLCTSAVSLPCFSDEVKMVDL